MTPGNGRTGTGPGSGRVNTQTAELDRYADRHVHHRPGGDGAGGEFRAVRGGHVGRGRTRAGIFPDRPAGRREGGQVGGRGGPVRGDDGAPHQHPGHAGQRKHGGEGQHPDRRGPALLGASPAAHPAFPDVPGSRPATAPRPAGPPPAAHPAFPDVPGSRTATASADTSIRSGSGPSGGTAADTLTRTSAPEPDTVVRAPAGAARPASAVTAASSSPRAAARAPSRAASTQRSSAPITVTAATAPARTRSSTGSTTAVSAVTMPASRWDPQIRALIDQSPSIRTGSRAPTRRGRRVR